ncbi:MAG: hypothetical protein ABI051_01045 [Vicinamibacterales bacterium]
MRGIIGRGLVLAAAMICLGFVTPAAAPRAQSDLDALMSQVLQRRDENWKKLQQYVLDEREQVTLDGPGGGRLWGERREYTWYIRDGFFVRSPLRVNGAGVPEAERLEYEQDFLKRAKQRDKTPGRGQSTPSAAATTPVEAPAAMEAVLAQTRRPQFIDSAYFLRFKFEPGHYGLVGHETFEKRDVLRVEYYPERLFTHEQDAQSRRRAERRTDRKEDVEAATERALNKVALVTLWVDPSVRQIVKYTFDNVDFDFLPGAWLVRADDAQATMRMSEPFPGVWLPADVQIRFRMLTAAGPFDIAYQLAYRDYREATSTGRLKSSGATR